MSRNTDFLGFVSDKSFSGRAFQLLIVGGIRCRITGLWINTFIIWNESCTLQSSCDAKPSRNHKLSFLRGDARISSTWYSFARSPYCWQFLNRSLLLKAAQVMCHVTVLTSRHPKGLHSPKLHTAGIKKHRYYFIVVRSRCSFTETSAGEDAGSDLDLARRGDKLPQNQKKGRLTASSFGRALGFWRGQRVELWREKVGFTQPNRSFSVQGAEFAENGELSPPELHQRTEEWHTLRKDRLTASSFGNALGFWKGRRVELWEEKVGIREPFAGNSATEWGVNNEYAAVQKYVDITGNIVKEMAFKIYKEQDELHEWLGASPDALIEGDKSGTFEKGGILEVKCPHNKGKPDLGVPWLTVPYYYIPQAQGLMEILNRDWMDFYVWMPNASSVFRIERDRDYWGLIFRVMSEFWWGNVIPAKQERLHGNNGPSCNVDAFRPSDTHPTTNVVIERSKKIASKARLIWTDAGLTTDAETDLQSGSYSFTILED